MTSLDGIGSSRQRHISASYGILFTEVDTACQLSMMRGASI
jgi:hypothetical protein